MSWTWKSTLLGATLAAVFIAVFGIQIKRVTSEAQVSQWRDSAIRQSALVERLILERTQNLKNAFPFSSFQGQPLGDLFSLAVDMELTPDGDLRVQDLRRTEEWTLGREETASLLSLLRERDYEQGQVYWFLRQSEGVTHHMMAFLGDSGGAGFPKQASGRRLWAAVFRSNPFDRLGDDFKATAAELTLQDSLGQVLLDSRSTENSVAQIAELGWSEVNGGGFYRAQVPGTNLTLTYRVSADAMNYGNSALTKLIIRLGVGILLLGSGLLFWWLRRSAIPEVPEEVPEQTLPAQETTETVPAESQIVEVPGPIVRPTEGQVGALADQLHTHLWGLLGPIHQLKKAGLVPEHQRMITQMEEHVRPLMGASDSLRSYLRKEDFPTETLNLAGEIRAVLASYGEAWKQAEITVVEELEEACWVKGSAYAFRKTLNELIKNSMDAMESVTPKILEFSLFKLDGEVRLRVADSGQGMEESVQPMAFEPFVGTKEGRLGLGLAFVQGVVQMMNGSAIFDARPTGGAQVLMTFKAAEAPAVKAAAIENASGQVPRASWPEPDASSVLATEKVPLKEEEEIVALSDDESWGLTTLDDDLSSASSAPELPEIRAADLSDEDEDEWSPVFSQVPSQRTPQIKVRSPKRRDLQT